MTCISNVNDASTRCWQREVAGQITRVPTSLALEQCPGTHSRVHRCLMGSLLNSLHLYFYSWAVFKITKMLPLGVHTNEFVPGLKRVTERCSI